MLLDGTYGKAGYKASGEEIIDNCDIYVRPLVAVGGVWAIADPRKKAAIPTQPALLSSFPWYNAAGNRWPEC
jgi:hypothetical protein